jgi:hypothetical protein
MRGKWDYALANYQYTGHDTDAYKAEI